MRLRADGSSRSIRGTGSEYRRSLKGRAARFNAQVPLGAVKASALDEMFTQGEPVLGGVGVVCLGTRPPVCARMNHRISIGAGLSTISYPVSGSGNTASSSMRV